MASGILLLGLNTELNSKYTIKSSAVMSELFILADYNSILIFLKN